MHRRAARGNRLGLALTGLLLMVGGAALFAAHEGWFGARAVRTAIYPTRVRHYVHENGDWLWTCIAIVAILVGLMFLRWLLVQLRVERLRRIWVDTDAASDPGTGEPGRTRMPVGALCDIVEDDINAVTGVRRATATMSGDVDAPELWLRVSAEVDADVARIRRSIVDDVIPDARRCRDRNGLPVYLRISSARSDTARTTR